MPTTATSQERQADSISIMDKALCISVQISKLGVSRKVHPSKVEVDADKTRMRFSKLLLSSIELDTISKLDGEIRQYLYTLCLPCPVFRAGVYLLPLTLVEEVDKRLRAYQQMRLSLVDEFLKNYDKRIQEAAEALKTIFDPKDYPKQAEVISTFEMKWRYFSFGVEQRLPPEMLGEEQRKFADDMREAQEEIKNLMRVALQDLADRMATKLKEERENGKPGIFKDTMVTKMQQFLATFDAKNIAQDAELAGLVAQAREIMSGVDPDLLRNNTGERQRVAAGMADLKSQLDSIITPGQRVIDLDDE